jgi:hypothetical protein
MKRDLGLGVIVGGMLAVSAALYAAEYAFFGHPVEIVSQSLHELAFLPIHAIVVVLVFESLLGRHEKASMLHKLNMVIGSFFSETGTEVLKRLAAFDRDLAGLSAHLLFDNDWTAADFRAARSTVADRKHALRTESGDLDGLRECLNRQRRFLLGLLENANLLEHEDFAELLWAMTHLSEELDARESLDKITATDRTHLEGDMARAYARLLSEWLSHAEHLKEDYPYLFSFTVRTNPFDPEARVEVAA